MSWWSENSHTKQRRRSRHDEGISLQQQSVRELLARQGMVPAGALPERFGDLLKFELARWSRVVAAAGIKAD